LASEHFLSDYVMSETVTYHTPKKPTECIICNEVPQRQADPRIVLLLLITHI